MNALHAAALQQWHFLAYAKKNALLQTMCRIYVSVNTVSCVNAAAQLEKSDAKKIKSDPSTQTAGAFLKRVNKG